MFCFLYIFLFVICKLIYIVVPAEKERCQMNIPFVLRVELHTNFDVVGSSKV